MSKARVKVTVRKRTGGKGGTLLARFPVGVEKNDNPSGKRLYQTKAQITIRPKTTAGGRPRISGGN